MKNSKTFGVLRRSMGSYDIPRMPHGGFSSERQDTKTDWPTQAADRPAAGQERQAGLRAADDDRLEHPLRDSPTARGPSPPAASGRSTCWRRKLGLGRRPSTAVCDLLQDPPALPRIGPRAEHRLQPAGRRHAAWSIWNCGATTRSISTPWAPAAFPTRPPPATSAAASTPATSTRLQDVFNDDAAEGLAAAARGVLRRSGPRRRRHDGRDDRRVQGGHGHHLQRPVGLPSAGRLAGQHRRAAVSWSTAAATGPATSRPPVYFDQVDRPVPPGRLPEDPPARRHRLHADRAPRPLGRPGRRAVRLRHRRHAEPVRPRRQPAARRLESGSVAGPSTRCKTTPRAAPGERQGADRRGARVREHPLGEGVRGRVPATRPATCQKTYRVVVVRKDLDVYRGQKKLFDDARCFFYITNDREQPAEEIVFEANDRCNQENLIAQLKSGVRSLTAPVDNLVSNWAYMVMASSGLEPEGLGRAAAARDGPLAGAAPRGETDAAADGLQHVPPRDDPDAGADRSRRAADRLSAAGLEPVATRLLPPAGPTCSCRCVVDASPLKPESGCSGPPPRLAHRVLTHATRIIRSTTSQPTEFGSFTMRHKTHQKLTPKTQPRTLV